MSGLTLYLLCLAVCLITVGAASPGFKTRITTKGLKYANDVAIQALKTEVEKIAIPPQSGESHHFKYSAKNIKVTQFTPPASTLSITPGLGLTWKAANAKVAISGELSYGYHFIHGTESFTASLSGISFNLGINIGKDAKGRPSISSRKCASSVGDVDFKFHGKMAWLFNLIKGKVESIIKSTLNGQMCKLIDREINVDGEKKLATVPVTVVLAKKFLLDYRLAKTPVFTPSYMETYHKGEIFWASAPNTEAPMTPPPMPDSVDTQNMVYLWVSDYTFDTLGYVAQKNGFLAYNLTAADLPASSRGILDTTCSGLIPKCIGRLISGIGDKYPNSQVELHMTSTKAPKMSISTSGISVQCAGTINLYARTPGKTTLPFLVTLDSTMAATVDVSLKNERLYAKIINLSFKLTARNSAVGPISDDLINFLIKEVLNVYLVPQLNSLGQKGFPLPVTDEFHFVNTKLSLAKDTIIISTDLSYKPSSNNLSYKPASKNEYKVHQSNPLKFKPSQYMKKIHLY